MKKPQITLALTLLLLAAAGLTVFWNTTPSAEALQKELRIAYQQKLSNPSYVKWKGLPGLPSTYQWFAEEQEIKRVRSQLASLLSCDTNAELNRIPSSSGPMPTIDGRIGESEWKGALRLPIGLDGSKSSLLLLSDGSRLYLACDAPDDTTGKGYDQFRFYTHVDLSPEIVNERIHVGTGTRARLGGIRQTNVRWEGPAPTSGDERWMKYPISDWQIYDKARGLSSIRSHRQYEAVLDLEETGLHLGVPFRAWVQVETDPALDKDGKFDHRVYVGQLGHQDAPHWFVVEKPAG